MRRELPDFAEVEFARSQIRERVHVEKLIGARFPQVRQIGLGQVFEAGLQLPVRKLVQNHKALAFFFVRHAGDSKRLFGHARQLVQLLFHFDVRHHFAADLAETAQTIGDLQEAVFVTRGDITGDIPAVAQDLGDFLRMAELPLHNVGSTHQQQARLANP